MIFHVAAAEHAARIDIFKSGENFFGRALGDVDDHVEASAMAHAHDQFMRAVLAGGVENLIDQRNQRGHAFEREALVAEIALLQHLLEDVGADQQIEDALLIDGGRSAFHALR